MALIRVPTCLRWRTCVFLVSLICRNQVNKQTNKEDAGKNNRLGKRPVTKRANEINPFDSPVAKVSVKGRQTVWQTRLIQIQVQVHKAES